MTDTEIPAWALNLLSLSEEPYRLSDENYLKLDAFLPDPVRFFFATPNSPKREDIVLYNKNLKRLRALRDYNKKLREHAVRSVQAPPTSVAEAISQGYVESNVIRDLLEAHFKTSARLSKYLTSHETQIRQYCPTANRRMVHAADFLTVMSREKKLEDDARSKVEGESKARRNSPRNKSGN